MVQLQYNGVPYRQLLITFFNAINAAVREYMLRPSTQYYS